MSYPLVSTSVRPAKLPRGTTWEAVITVMVANGTTLTPANLLGHHMLVTVRSLLVDGTADASQPPIWQGDSNASGVVFAIPSGTATWSSGATITVNSYWAPTAAEANGSFYQCTNAGSGTVGTTQPAWPLAQGASTAADSNGVVWTWAGYTNVATATMPASATQALPNPVTPTIPLYYDVVDAPGDGTEWQTEEGAIPLSVRVTLTQP